MMADFMSQDVGLREFTRGAEALLELVVKTEIDIHLFIARTVERAGGGFRAAAAGLRVVAEEHQLGVVIWPVGLLREDFGPGLLVVVENERDELDEWALGVIAFRIGAASRGRRTGAAATEKREEILLKDQTEDQ